MLVLIQSTACCCTLKDGEESCACRDMPYSCRHRTNRSMLLAKVMALEPWADGAAVKAQLDVDLDTLLGPKTAADEQPLDKNKKKKVQARLEQCSK